MELKSKTRRELVEFIGLEVHLQLATEHKMFCRCPLPTAGTPPNTLICPICLGYPGTLPQLNREALEKGIKLALALKARLAPVICFDRKNYFYPDLPKNYQISQRGLELASKGELLVDYLSSDKKRSESLKVELVGVHFEEDTGKLLHEKEFSLIDFNRAGVPLLEITTRPKLRSPREARLFAKELQNVARAIGVSRAEMEFGGLRIDANISLGREDGKLGAKVEIKNLNSFVSLEKALSFEIQRQRALLKQGQQIVQETRGWDQREEKTVGQRTKEYAADYRYFPEPDLPEIILDRKPKISFLLPSQQRKEALRRLPQPAKIYMLDDTGKLTRFLRATARLRDRRQINQIASRLLVPRARRPLIRVPAGRIRAVVRLVLAEYPHQLQNLKQGRENIIHFFVGQALKKLGGKADPRALQAEIRRHLTK